MLSQEERQEIRTAIWLDLAEIEQQISRQAGSYEHLCPAAG
jgi:hypothetical protein